MNNMTKLRDEDTERDHEVVFRMGIRGTDADVQRIQTIARHQLEQLDMIYQMTRGTWTGTNKRPR